MNIQLSTESNVIAKVSGLPDSQSKSIQSLCEHANEGSDTNEGFECSGSTDL